MKGDFSRSSFDAKKHYRGVRLQQGRVQLDADWNEQIDIVQQHDERTLGDLLGAQAAPQAQQGFAISLPATITPPAADAPLLPPDVQIAQGSCYVAGILCINEADCTFATQPDFPGAGQHRQEMAGHARQLVYLDVWQHHVTAREDPALREVALDGLDTATRSKTVAQVKFWPVPTDLPQDEATPALEPAFAAFLAAKQQPKGRLSVQKLNRGAILQNQLYRVEIHRVDNNQVSFKWSRENGAIAYSILKIEVNGKNSADLDIYLKDVKPDQLDLRNNDWVEIGGNLDTLDGKAGAFARVIDIQPDVQRITVKPVADQPAMDAATCEERRMQLQRWDQKENADGVVVVRPDEWMTLENELQVKFSAAGLYTVGDYWLIPARVNLNRGTGGILWPPNESKFPDGVTHQYAPLALLTYQAGQWRCATAEGFTWRPLPVLTAEVDDLTTRVSQAEAAITDLQTRVQKLEEQMVEVWKYVKLEQSSLYQNFKSTVELERGDVVAIDPMLEFHVTPANATNQPLVVGVVDEVVAGEFPYRVILQGRAHCKVLHAVKAGALLVPAELDGHARQGGLYLQPGSIIGKALRQHLPDGPEDVGMIEVLVTLN